MPTIDLSADLTVGYDVFGEQDAEPVLMICPSAQNRLVYLAAARALSDNGYRVITYDNRGMGESSRGAGVISTGQLAIDGLALLDALGIDRAHVFGWSIGSAIAQELAIAHPERVATLVLYATWAAVDVFQRGVLTAIRHTWDTRNMDEILAAMAIVFSPELINSPAFPDVVSGVLPTLPSNDDQITATIEQFDADLRHDTLGRLASIVSPALVVAGEQDLFTPVRQGQAVAEAITGARIEVLSGPGSSHALMFERSEEFFDIVLDFLRQHPLHLTRPA
ncbi:alpha/beta fold hydrolase [Actinoplanes sp. HUAS TT8]|uniref:alpha/beta fold hydrolase n=1 Tax=Actinoplanes sp. HUAS TT8 TaxID=3447453 RepID=UPI003F5222B5